MAGKTLPPLKIGNLTAEVPLIQGGIGVRISLAVSDYQRFVKDL